MRPGDVVGERFELTRLAGSGGMGEVFQADDLTTGETVAVKVLLPGNEAQAGRFTREAQLLRDLKHPGIVRHIDHGMTPSGEPYMVMEWLAGEDLQSRLARRGLTLDETLTLITRSAEALAAAHEKGIVHRDFKPSNLFLVNESVSDIRVLDFGIAWLGGSTRVTRTGTLVGTPGYMAPEQARTGQEIDARADVFALGCVLFECLTGTAAFTGEHFMAVLAKVLFEESPRARDIRPEVPPAIDELCARMLAKNPAARPKDGAAVAAAIEAIAAGRPVIELETTPPSLRPRSSALTVSERRLLSVVLIGGKSDAALGTAETIVTSDVMVVEEQLKRRAAAHNGRVEALADGSIAVTITGTTRSATDQAAQAARCALAMREVADDRPISLATGRGVETGRLPVGEAIDRAAALLAARAAKSARTAGAGARGGIHEPIAIDDATAGLLGPMFDVTSSDVGMELHGERDVAEEARTLLGKPSPCVGRDRELGALSAMFAECADEEVATAALVLAPAGIGKSRLARELIRVLQKQHERLDVWIGRGDPLRAGSALGLLGQAIRSACGMIGGEPIEVRRQKLWARVSRRVAPADQARVAEFIGELLDTPMRDEDPPPMSVRAGEQVSASPPSPGSSPSSAPPASPALRAARQDAQVMGDQIRKACLDLLEAECSDHPILLVLEDLHWCDPPTVRFIDAALRALRERPLMVLALARPEVHERFPKLWADRDVQEMRLRELTRKASERLVREVLGDRVGQGTLDRLVEQADGHAFFLEELIRAVAQGKGDALPDTVLAMVQARLFGLDAQSRRVLRAASVFGEHFWVGGVVALLGGVMRSTQTGDVLSALVEQEVIVRRAESRFPGDPEFAFRHALLREGAYGMLTESDRVLGHKLAAGYLDQSGETDPMVIAEHYERGRDPARAGSFYVRAAEQAFRGSDPDEGMRRAERGLQCGVPDALRIELLSLLAEGYVWRHQWRRAAGYAEEVMRLAEPGSAPWAKAAVAKLVNAQSLGRMDEFNQTLEQLFSVKPSPESLGVTVLCLSLTAFILDANGRFDLGAVCMGHLRALIEPVSASEAMESTLDAVGAQEALASEAPGLTPPPTRRVLESGVRPSDRARSDAPPGERLSDVIEAGYRMSYITAHLTFAMHLWMLGAQEEARREIDLTAGADELLGPAASIKAFYLVSVLADAGALEEARREAEVAVEQGKSKHLRVDEGRGRYALGDVLRRAGELSAAEREVTAAIDLLTIVPLDHLAAMATLAAIKLAAGRTAEALELSDEVVKRLEALGGFDYKGAFARAVHAEALHAAGDVEAARRAIAAARARLLENAGRISDPELRRSYLERVPENARTMELARAWVDCA